MQSRATSEGRALRVLAPVVLAILAFAVRSLAWPSVGVPGRVQLPDPDAYYHLRRIVYALVNWPASLGFDPYLSFPDGARAIWPPLFDVAIAWLLAPWVGTGAGVDPARVEAVAVWLPPLLGAATVVVTHAWMRRHFGPGPALGAAGLLSVLSASSWYARVGAIDHHVVVALGTTLALGAAMRLLERSARGALAFGRAAGLGALFALLLQVWPGALLHVAAVEAGLAAWWLSRPDREDAVRFGWTLAWLQVVTAALLWLAGWAPPGVRGDWAVVVLSRFQPLAFAATGAVALACSLLWSRSPSGGRPAARTAQALGLGALVAGVALLALPGLAQSAAEAWTWLGRGERFQASVLESRPLFSQDGELDLRLAAVSLSRFVFVFPLAWLWLVRRELRGARRPQLALLAIVTLGLGLATLLQARFSNSFALPLAAFFALSVEALWRELAPRVGRGPAAVGLAVAALWLWLPVSDAYRAELPKWWAVLRGGERVYSPEDRYWQALQDTAVWLRERTPPPGNAYASWEPGFQPAWGVLGHWQYGHLILYAGERPTVVGNFGDDLGGDHYELSFEYFRTREARAVEILDRLRARYVVIRPVDVAGGDHGAGSMIRRLADPDGGFLARHRLVHERRVLRDPEAPRSHFRIYERVQGVRVVGSAPPGAVVEARLDYASPTGRRGAFRRTAVSDEGGVYRLRLPYATRGAPSDIETDDAWRIGVEGGPEQRVAVDESDVQSGARLDGPDLRQP